MQTRKKHIPALTTKGLKGKALCGRQVKYPTGNHNQIRFEALTEDPHSSDLWVKTVDKSDQWCQSCLAEFRGEQYSFERGDKKVRRLRLKPDRDRHRERMIKFVKGNYSGLSLDEIAARENVPIKVVDMSSWQTYLRKGIYKGKKGDSREAESTGGNMRSDAFGHLGEITLNPDMDPEEREFTLAHELGHHFLDSQFHMMPTRVEGKLTMAPYYDGSWEGEATRFGTFLISLSKMKRTKPAR